MSRISPASGSLPDCLPLTVLPLGVYWDLPLATPGPEKGILPEQEAPVGIAGAPEAPGELKRPE